LGSAILLIALGCGTRSGLSAPVPDGSSETGGDDTTPPAAANACPAPSHRCRGAWSEPALVLPSVSGGDNGNIPALAVGPDCTVQVASAEGIVRYARLAGSSWIQEVVDADGEGARFIAMALDTSGEPQLAWWARRGGVHHARRLNGRWQVELVGTASPLEQGVALALDATGAAHIAFTTPPGLAAVPDIAYVTNAGGSWRPPELVAPRATGPSIAINRSGTVFIAYGRNSETKGVELARREASGWRAEPLSADAVEDTAIALDPAGEPHVLYMVLTVGDGVREAQPGGQGGGPITRRLPLESWRPTAVIDAQGAMHVAVAGVTYATNATGAWQAQRVSYEGWAPALALDPDGIVHLAFTAFRFGGAGVPSGGGAPVYYVSNGGACP
jgi:hypothetical protein